MKLRDLFGPGATPAEQFSDPVFGTMTWCEDDESWECVFEGRRVLLAYDRASSVPLGELLDYARSVLLDRIWISETLTQAKRDYALKHPSYEAEVESLEVDTLYFSTHKKGNFMRWDLGEPVPDHFWAAEFRGRELLGLGFDS